MVITGPFALPVLMESGETICFNHTGFSFARGRRRYSVLHLGEIHKAFKPLIRISSNCQYAFYFGSRLCDCRWQLERAKAMIAAKGIGLVIFAHDEHGKSIGIENHWRVYTEGQKQGCDLVVDAYKLLGFEVDYRKSYQDVAIILRHFGITEVRLLTNNLQRAKLLQKEGIEVEMVPLEQPLNSDLVSEYEAKKKKLGHRLKLKKVIYGV